MARMASNPFATGMVLLFIGMGRGKEKMATLQGNDLYLLPANDSGGCLIGTAKILGQYDGQRIDSLE